MLLNLGVGDWYAEGWHNVDWAGSPHRKDETVDLTGPLPWAEGTVQLAYAGHLLEHLTLDGCHHLLTQLRPCMATDGQLLVVGPDATIARALAAAGTLDITLDSLLYGAQRWLGDQHLWECTAAITVDLLTAAGWQGIHQLAVSDVPAVWPIGDRRPVWQYAIKARP